MRLSEAMTQNLKTIKPDDTLLHAAKVMNEHNVGILPIVEDDRAIGVLTDRDLITRAMAFGRDPAQTHAEEVMSRQIYAVGENEHIEAAMQLMKAKKVGRVIVTKSGGKLAGILSASDAAALCNGDKRAGQLVASIASRTRRPANQAALR